MKIYLFNYILLEYTYYILYLAYLFSIDISNTVWLDKQYIL